MKCFESVVDRCPWSSATPDKFDGSPFVVIWVDEEGHLTIHQICRIGDEIFETVHDEGMSPIEHPTTDDTLRLDVNEGLVTGRIEYRSWIRATLLYS